MAIRVPPGNLRRSKQGQSAYQVEAEARPPPYCGQGLGSRATGAGAREGPASLVWQGAFPQSGCFDLRLATVTEATTAPDQAQSVARGVPSMYSGPLRNQTGPRVLAARGRPGDRLSWEERAPRGEEATMT